MSENRISHMESCLHCGTTTSSAGDSNEAAELFADRYIGLSVRAGDVAALHELASQQVGKIGLFYQGSGGAGDGPSCLYKLRCMRIARKALEAAELLLEPLANDIHEFDKHGHKI